jgi:hypothetical protein
MQLFSQISQWSKCRLTSSLLEHYFLNSLKKVPLFLEMSTKLFVKEKRQAVIKLHTKLL